MNIYKSPYWLLPSEHFFGELRAVEVRGNGKNATFGKGHKFTGSVSKGIDKSQKSGKIIEKTKYAPSPRRNNKGITISPKTYAMLCSQFMIRYPSAKKGDTGFVYTDKMQYWVERDDYGGLIIKSKTRRR